MIRLLFILLAMMTSWPLLGQTKLTAEQQKQIIEKIDQTASAMTGMQCDFVQTKRMKLIFIKLCHVFAGTITQYPSFAFF